MFLRTLTLGGIALLTLAAPAVAQDLEEEMIASIRDPYPNLVAVLETEFPDDFEALITDLIPVATSGGSVEETMGAAAARMLALRQSYNDLVYRMSDEQLTELAVASAQYHEQIQRDDGDLACAAVGAGGPLAIEAFDPVGDYTGILDVQQSAYFRAVADVLASKVKEETVQPASPEDFSALSEYMLDNGLPTDQLTLLQNMAGDNPDYCDAVIAFIRSLSEMEGDVGYRLRASFAQTLNGL